MGGGGSTYDYGFRIYNPQIAKFLSVDPLTKSYPWYTPYQFAGNKPIRCVDLDGLEELSVIEKIDVMNLEIIGPDDSKTIIDKADYVEIYYHTDNIANMTNGSQRNCKIGDIAGYVANGQQFAATYTKVGNFDGFKQRGMGSQASAWKDRYYDIKNANSYAKSLGGFADAMEKTVFNTSVGIMLSPISGLSFTASSVSSGFADFASQMTFKQDFNKWNISQSISSAIFKNSFMQSGVGSAFELTPQTISDAATSGKVNGLVGNTIFGDKTTAKLAWETGIGGVSNYLAGKLNSNAGLNEHVGLKISTETIKNYPAYSIGNGVGGLYEPK